MKKNDLKEVKTLDIKELKARVVKARTEVADLTMEKNMKKLKNIKEVVSKRKNLAQMLTVLRQKELLEQLSILSGQLSDNGQPVVSKSVTDQQKTDNRKSGGKKK